MTYYQHAKQTVVESVNTLTLDSSLLRRNLLCVHSKKHINDIPELTEQKLASNRRTLKEMAKLFK